MDSSWLHFNSYRSLNRYSTKKMQVKKRTLYIVCPIVLLVAITGSIGYARYSEKKEKERAIERAVDAYNWEVEREYSRMKGQYEDYVETINDDSYSYDFRKRYIRKVYDLIGYQYSYDYEAFDVWCFAQKQRQNKERDLSMLKSKAADKVYKSLNE